MKQASAPTSYHSWWIECPLDKSCLNNQSFDCAIMMSTFNKEEREQVKDMLFTAYPTKYNEVYNIHYAPTVDAYVFVVPITALKS